MVRAVPCLGVVQAPVSPEYLFIQAVNDLSIALTGTKRWGFFTCACLGCVLPGLEAVGAGAGGAQGWFVLADAGLLLQRHPQPGDHAGRAPEDHPGRDPGAAGTGDPDARPGRAGVSRCFLQMCGAPAR